MSSAALKEDNSSHVSSNVIIPEDADHSILQQPLNLGVKNVKQILKCIESGSREVKDIILNECNIIYECKVCSSLFRSLANFLYHKRGFCKKHLCENMLLFETFDETESTVVHPQPVQDEKLQENTILNSDSNHVDTEKVNLSNLKNNINEGNDILSVNSGQTSTTKVDESNVEASTSVDEDVVIIDNNQTEDEKTIEQKCEHNSDSNTTKSASDNIVSQQTSENISPNQDIKGNIATGKASDLCVDNKNIKIKEVIPIILKPIIGNQSAVFQVVKKQSVDNCSIPVNEQKKFSASLDSHKAEEEKKLIIVVPNKNAISSVANYASKIEENSNAVKPKDIHLTRRKKLLNRSDCSVQALKCLKCNTHFTTLKTLYFHMMSFHSQKRMYFPCPFCKNLFVQMYGVTRHLIQVHGKTKEQINNKMRDAIRKTAVWKRINHTDVKEKGNEASEKENDHEESLLKEEAKTESKLLEIEKKHNNLLHSYVKVENNLTLHHCSKCERVFSRKSSQVSHEKFCIMNSPSKTENSDQVATPITHSSPVSVVSHEIEKKNPFEIKLSVRPKRGAEKQMHKDFVDSQTLKWRSANKIETGKAASPNVNKKALKTYERKILSMVNSEKLLCLKCNRKFSSFSNLRRHAAIHIGWTRFKCKCCEYQSYNKSDCIHHIERMHATVPEQDVEKYVINLVSELSPSKPIYSPKSVTPTKVLDVENGKSTSGRRKKGIAKKINLEKKKPQTPSPQKRKHAQGDAKVIPDKRPTSDSKKKKNSKSRTYTKVETQCVKKLPSNYRSVTTNSPTTIILAKTCSSSTVQITKNTAPVPIHHSDFVSDKVSPTRVSPRKSEHSLKLCKSSPALNFESSENVSGKSNVVKIRVPCQVSTKLNLEEKNDVTPEKNVMKKTRFISDWFIKKDLKNVTDATISVSRRDTAPVIIDLVPASSGFSRAKSANSAPTKQNGVKLT